MLRFLNVMLALVALGLAVACGRQVTPEPSTSNLTGQMVLKLSVAGSLNLTGNGNGTGDGYMAIINTSGAGGTPNYPNYQQKNFQAFSYAFVVGSNSLQGLGSCGAGGLPLSSPALLQYYTLGQASGLGCISHPLPPTVLWVPNFGGATNEFEIVFPRSLLAFPPVTGTSAPSSAPSASPSASPSPVASGASPTPTPVPSPTTAAQATWYVNFFTTDATGRVLDAFGGLNQVSFNPFVVNTNSTMTIIQQNPELSPPSDPNAAITSAEVDNFP